jgi:hypothetical protein
MRIELKIFSIIVENDFKMNYRNVLYKMFQYYLDERLKNYNNTKKNT